MSVCTIVSTDYENINSSKNEYESDVFTLKHNLRTVIWDYFCKGVMDFYINCEYGIPLWAGEIIIALKSYNHIKLHIVVPYEEHNLNWQEDWRDRYYKVHQHADSIAFSSQHYNDDCYNNADEIMADESDTILIFGDKSEKFYIADYAEKNKIDVEYVKINKLLELTS